MRRIGVLTSGGDAPGMNATVRAVVRSADHAGVATTGIMDGWNGAIEGRFLALDSRTVSGILGQGGTLLGTVRSEAFYTRQGRATAAATLGQAGIDGLVVIGGNGSYRGAWALHREHGIPVAGVPGTIDNDLAGTDVSLGFDTAVNTALDAVDRIRDTATSHRRLFFIEVMGRESGQLALATALAGGATEAVVAERPTDAVEVADHIRGAFELGKRFCLIVVAEGDESGGATALAEKISATLEVDYRVATLGHLQRGGSPTARDRLLAARLGDAAVRGLVRGDPAVALGEQRGEVVQVPIEQAVGKDLPPVDELLSLMDRLAR
jgi:6-phosphofructokinase 1